MNNKYPLIDRSNHKPNFAKRDRDDQIDIAFSEDTFKDGRPFRAEYWAANQVSYLTYYFSSVGIEDLSATDLQEYLKSQHAIEFDDKTFLAFGYTGANTSPKKIFDASGNEMWEVTIIVGDEDGTYVRGGPRLQRYPKS